MRSILVLLLSILLIAPAQDVLAKGKHKIKGKKRAKVVKIVKPPKPASPVAKEIFGRQTQPSPLASRAIGGYAKGCLMGGKALPIDGPAWQAMRLSRNRNWGHPVLVSYVERLAREAQQHDGWHGLLVGDLAQPMGGPMLTGHASHQIGLDADIWLMQMPNRTLSPIERENNSAVSMLAEDGVSVDRKIWTPEHVKLIKRAASDETVSRIFVHPAIKKALCTDAPKDDREWLSKVRPWWGHHYHFHVRLSCPAGSAGCVDQPKAGPEDGCGKEVDSWLKKMRKPAVAPQPGPKKPLKPKRQMTLAELPADCQSLVAGHVTAQDIPVPTEAVPMPVRRPSELVQKAATRS
jgi:penicillin-insensitive murein endopeptidase